MTTPSAPGPEDVAEAVRSGRAPSELPGAELVGPPSAPGEALRAGTGTAAAAAGTDAAPAEDDGPGDEDDGPGDEGDGPGDEGVGTTPSRMPPTAPGEDGYADSPDRRPRLPEAPGLDDSPVEAAGVRVLTRGAAVLAARDAALAGLAEHDVARALAEKDPTLWGPDASAEASVRLGWLDLPETSRALLPRLAALRDELAAEGLDRVVLVGTGPAALAAEAVAADAGTDLVLLDSSDPGDVRAALAEPARTVVVVTEGPGSADVAGGLRRLAVEALGGGGATGADAGRRFVAVAVPDSPLDEAARAEGFRAVLPADAGVAAPFGALSAAALVPAALAGADCAALLDAAAALRAELAHGRSPGLALGALLGGAGVAGREAVVLAPDDGCPPGLARWVEHLLAGATAGEGRGLLPVVVESPDAPGTERQADAQLVVLGGRGRLPGEPEHGTRVTGPLGAQLLLWEHAVAVAAHLLRVNPFELPAVAELAGATAAALASRDDPTPPALVDGPVEVHDEGGLLTGVTDLRGALTALVEAVPLGGYLAVTAHLDRDADDEATRLRTALARRLAHPVTLGRGGAAVHGAAQLHLAGPATGVFLQVTAAPGEDVRLPGDGVTAAGLQAAQARAELRALVARGRPVLRVHLADRRAGLAHLLEALS